MNTLFVKSLSALRASLCCVWALLLGGAAFAEDSPRLGYPDLPIEVASFGAAVSADTLYVYGGHIGKTHQHSIQNLSRGFYSLKLNEPGRPWQLIEETRGLQGLALVGAGQWVCRMGGMEARNEQEAAEEELYSIAEVTCFDTLAGAWVPMPSLPAGRSSHDAVVSGSRIYVVGGWQLRGASEDPVWHDTIEVLDMAGDRQWHSLDQPFTRRALTVAAHAGKVYAFGGLGPDGATLDMEVFDEATQTWSHGGSIPDMNEAMRGFGVSAFGVKDGVYLSGNDGQIHFLDSKQQWQRGVAQLAQERFFHRLLPYEDGLLAVAGASREGHLGSVEAVTLAERTQEPTSIAAPVADESRGEAAATSRWPGFRGDGSGYARATDLPLSWSTALWRTSLAGYGQSSPVVWDGQVFLTSIEGDQAETLIVSSIDLQDGTVRWRRRFEASQLHENTEMYSRAAPTPVVGSEALYVFWESGDLVALTHEGETLWARSLTTDYGEFLGNHGVASSPVLVGDLLVLQVTHEGPSYFVGLDRLDGKTQWKLDRPSGVAWTTPAVVTANKGHYIVSSAAGRVELMDAESGELLWVQDGIEKNHVPSVAVEGGLIVAPSSDPGQSLALALNLDDVAQAPAVRWRTEGAASGFGSPLIHGDCVLFNNKAGIVQCVDPASGEKRWQHRLDDATWASPIASGGYAYFFLKNGTTTVLSPNAQGPNWVGDSHLELEGPVHGVAATQSAFILRTGKEVVRVAGLAGSDPETAEPVSAD